MIRTLSLITLIAVLAACQTEGVERTTDSSTDSTSEKPQKRVGTDVKDSTSIDLEDEYEVEDEMTLSNGMVIKWFKHGNGAVVKDGDMIELNYNVTLEDGTPVESSKDMGMKSVPFMVGFQMQPSWDHALRELRLGDHVEVFIPYQLARGDKEIKGVMPAKSNNIVKMHVVGLKEPDRVIDGTRVWMFARNDQFTTEFGPNKRIGFHCYISSPSHPLYYDSQKLNNPFNYGYGEPGLVPGLKKALNNAKKADLMLVHVPADQAYGNQGYLDYVKPNEDLFYRIFVIDVKDQTTEN
ncbi:MAG: FKBP-type peptidyl-prolyl cis-trans isomerase [bacterium]|nr:FKBP-type peptidyl-prolyl cis-trans isomerase [bacterium]